MSIITTKHVSRLVIVNNSIRLMCELCYDYITYQYITYTVKGIFGIATYIYTEKM